MKRLLSVVLSVAMLLSLTTISAFADTYWTENAPTMSVTANAPSGDYLTVDIGFGSSAVQIGGITLNLTYDATMVTVVTDANDNNHGSYTKNDKWYGVDFPNVLGAPTLNTAKSVTLAGDDTRTAFSFQYAGDENVTLPANSKITVHFKLTDAGKSSGQLTFAIATGVNNVYDVNTIVGNDNVSLENPAKDSIKDTVAIPMSSAGTISGTLGPAQLKGNQTVSDSLTSTNSNVDIAIAYSPELTENKTVANTTYTATVTVTPKTGYAFADNATITSGIDGLTFGAISNGKFVGTKQFVIPQKAVSALTVTTQPTKTAYTHGDTFDASGMVVKATYDDGTEDAAFTGYTVGYQTSGKNYIVKGNTKVTLTAGTVSTDVTITSSKKTLDAPTVTATNRDYEADNTSVALTVGNLTGVVAGEDVTFEKPTTGTISDANAGEGKTVTISNIALTGDDAGNYTLTQPTGVTVTINKINATNEMKTASASLKYGKSGTLNLSTDPTLPTGATLGDIVTTDSNSVLSTCTLSLTTLNFTFANDSGKAGKRATVKIPVTASTNYKPYDITVTLTALDKNPQDTLAFTTAGPIEKVYGDTLTNAINNETIKDTSNGATVTGYASTNEDVATVNSSGAVTIKTAGTTKIQATVGATEDYAETTIEYTLTVTKAAISVTATDASKTYGEDDPASFAFTGDSYKNSDSKATILTGALARVTGENVGEYAINQGTLALTTDGAKKYTLTVTPGTFTINAKSLSGATVTVGGTYTYNGSAQTPSASNVEVKFGSGDPLTNGTDYTFAVTAGGTDAGSATVTVTGKGNYSGTETGTFTIAPKSIAGVTITGLPTSTEYTGTAITPTYTVQDGTKTLTKGSDYTEDYNSTNTNVGTATLTITGKGNYDNATTKTATFTITKGTQTAPTVSGVAPTASDAADSKISGTTTAMEYSTDGTTWTDCTETDTTVEPGTYKVRLKATANLEASPVTEVTVPEFGKFSVTVSGGTGGGQYVAGADVTVTAGAAPMGQKFKQWTADGITLADGTQETQTFTMPSNNVTLTATYEDVAVESVSIPATLSLTTGGSQTLTATITPSNAKNKAVTWSSDAENVASVDANGKVTAVTVGTATITVTTADGGKTATCAVTVSAPVTPSNPTTPTTPTPTDTDSTIGGGGGGGYTPRDRDTDSSNTTNKNTTTNADGSTTTTVKNSDGSVTETTRATDGSTTTTKTEKTGEATTTEKAADGSTGTTKTDAAGNTVAASATVSQQAVRNAARYGSAVKVPVSVKASNSAASAAAVDIALPETSEPVAVEIPVENVSAGTVAVIVHPDGTEEIVKTSTVGKDGVVLTLDGSAKVKIVDNSKYFADVPSYEWYSDNVAWASSREIMNGTGDFAFAPNDPTSRSMVAQLLFNLDGAAAPNEITALFADVNPSDWYANSVTWAINSGVARGMGDNLFGANQVVTREQFAVMMYNYAKLKGYDVSTSGSLASFPDAGSVSDWAADAMAWAVGVGLINGTTDANGSTVLNAQGTATRAQVAAIMQRFCEKVAK